ncbi:MAG TPA: hypothetical protein VFN67_33075 [Polyangiales bacterium]|nr:hypothetical protein [Polyangiales bacterium]
MKHLLASILLLWAALGSSGCNVDETHLRCQTDDDCVTGDECYLGFCVAQERRDAATGERRDTAAESDAGMRRRRATPTLTGRSSRDVDAGARVGMGGDVTDGTCKASDDDAGASEGACCDTAVACYEGPKETRGVGRCKDGKRACADAKLGACEGSVKPRNESCDNQGTDDDCDGMVDNLKDRGKECMLPASSAACGKGALACVDGKKDLQCVLQTPPAEVCNAKDDDCDSKVDESFDLEKDAMNCGACGTRCTNAQACCGGACVARGGGPDGCPECSAAQPCAAGRTCCGGACVDVQASNNNCGVCGNACAARQSCCNGMCVDTRADEKNCGRCGTACTQGAATTCCAGSCVDITNDRRNCGACGMNCGVVCSCEPNNGQPECRGPLTVCF